MSRLLTPEQVAEMLGVSRRTVQRMAAAGELTKDEIDAQFPGAFIDGGGYNCRHAWVPVDAADMVNQEAAQKALDANA